MHTLCAFSALLLQPLLSALATVPSPSPSDVGNESATSSLHVTNSSTGVASSNLLAPPISLTFDLFGYQIPSSAVNAAFKGAITTIYPFLQDQPDSPVANDNFQYRAVGGSVQIGVTAILHRRLSWRQLNSVMRQVSSYMNGDVAARRQHMQELAFEISTSGTRVGEGLVSYHPSRGPQSGNAAIANVTKANGTELLPPPTNPSLNAPTAGAIRFRVPDTPFTLIFGFFGDAIPVSEVWAAFEGAHSEIVGPLGQHPASAIPGDRFEYNGGSVRIIVLASTGTVMNWKQLSWVLGGMYGFMTGTPEYYQLLTCEITSRGIGSVGFASVWYYPQRLQVTKRALPNTAVSSPLDPNAGGLDPFPVPNTPIILFFRYLGTPIPPRELEDAILAALDQIDPSYREHGADPVPGNHFFRALEGVGITVVANVPIVMSWIQLHSIMWGLLLFVTGADGGNDRHRVLNFDANDARTRNLAYGTLRYGAPRAVDLQA